MQFGMMEKEIELETYIILDAMINVEQIEVGDKVCLNVKGVLRDCLVIYKDAIEYQCQTKDKSPLFEKWTSLLLF